MIVEGGEGDPEGLGLLEGALGGGDADDASKFAGGEEGPDLSDDEGGGGAGAEAKNHAASDVLHGLHGGELLEVVLGEGGCRGPGGGGEGSDGVHRVAVGGGEEGGAEGNGMAAEEEGGFEGGGRGRRGRRG